jgi:hypothetical protein
MTGKISTDLFTGIYTMFAPRRKATGARGKPQTNNKSPENRRFFA